MKTLAFLCGLTLGFGLLLSGMTDPAKVLNFLDIAGPWDPSLMLVMVSAVVVAFPFIQVASRRRTALLGDTISFPSRFGVNKRLLIGSAVFGIGWGLGGLCPGPSLSALGGMSDAEGMFFIAMLAGMLAYEAWERAGQVSKMEMSSAKTS